MPPGCISSCSYIKPQPARKSSAYFCSCISSCSYIKPQRSNAFRRDIKVVYHLVPTSNHNRQCPPPPRRPVVYHLVPTSNHNRRQGRCEQLCVVYHLVPTSNHNCWGRLTMRRRVVYHLVPTSNHNSARQQRRLGGLYIILFLHQTTTRLLVVLRSLLLYIILFLHQTTT